MSLNTTIITERRRGRWSSFWRAYWKPKPKQPANRDGFTPRSGALVAITCALLGLILAHLNLGQGLVRWSFDLPFAFRPLGSESKAPDTVLIELDERSLQDLQASWLKGIGALDRGLHAQLVEHLIGDRAKLIVFDILFPEPFEPETDLRLARAIQSHGRVVLTGSTYDEAGGAGWVAGLGIKRPYDLFLTNAASWGLGVTFPDSDSTVRRHHPGTESNPSLAWAAAALVGAEVTRAESEREREAKRYQWSRWLNFYNPDPLVRISYSEATRQSPGFFTDKYVFIGSRNKTGHLHEEKDEYAISYTRFPRGRLASGAEIQAVTFLNLMREDWLRRMSWWKESLWVLAFGGAFGWGLRRLRPKAALAVAILGMVGAACLGIGLVASTNVWLAWAVPALAQIPFALVASLVTARPEAIVEPPGEEGALVIPNHTLVREIGRGAYGQVWLAQNQIGLLYAVKIVSRNEFKSDSPYEREYKGIENYMPISLSHPSLLPILFVGRNDRDRYFFYIMEAADDEHAGQSIHSDHYSPRSLARDLSRKGPLTPEDCLGLMIHLTSALSHLHAHQLIHRDIKPANIIYVRNVPKFADIGLVADIALPGAATTYIGTEGYIAPEGPGTVKADLYSLGKVLYVALTGLSAEQFPELPTVALDPISPVMGQLIRIMNKACDPDYQRRYQSIVEMQNDVLRLSESLRVLDHSNPAG